MNIEKSKSSPMRNVYEEVNSLLKDAERRASYNPGYYNEDVAEDRMEGRHKAEILKKVIEIIKKEFPNITS